MTHSTPEEVTYILDALRQGEEGAWAKLVPLVYAELRKLADQQMARSGPGGTLQATDLVHEAYVRLAQSANPSWANRRHFYGAAAQSMRDILVTAARRRSAHKRGGDWQRIQLQDQLGVELQETKDVLALEEALGRLVVIDPLQHEIVMLRYFAGLAIDEVAKALDVSPSTVDRHWRFARAWLLHELSRS
jgi:RNA polymerase sigma factor (TIGR02999 family)